LASDEGTGKDSATNYVRIRCSPLYRPTGRYHPGKCPMTQTTSPTGGSYKPSADSPLFLLAMDHRTSFATLFGISGEPTDAEIEKMRDAKLAIYEALHLALAEDLPKGRAGVLVDEHLGPDVAKRARADGLVLAMPIEKSGTKLFELEYGEHFAEHVEAYDPDFFKVLVRYNPADDEQVRTTQIERLARISAWAMEVGRSWLFELLVPPTGQQLVENEDQYHFDQEARPKLTVETISAFVAGGVHPTIWKLEGYETTRGAQAVLRAVAADTAHPAECIVLGRNAPMSSVEHWIDVAAPLPGFAGFAVGRSLWEQPLIDLLGERIDRRKAVRSIAARYRTLTHEYNDAQRAPHNGHTDPFTWENPRLTPDREETIRRSLSGADMRGTKLPAWMAATLLAEVDALRSDGRHDDSSNRTSD
jgi:myo-inositol catabolism protein IolC